MRIVSTVAGCRSEVPRGCSSRFCPALVRVQDGDLRQPGRGSGCRPGRNTEVGSARPGALNVSCSYWAGPVGASNMRSSHTLGSPGGLVEGQATSNADVWAWPSAGLGYEPLAPRLHLHGMSRERGRSLGPHTPAGCLAISEAFGVLGQGQCPFGN